MYAFVFEDKPITPSSRLLKSSYNGSRIYFSSGNGLIRNKVDELIASGYTDIIVFLDVNPNNSSTISLLNSLTSIRDLNEKWQGVLIVPIICIEFYIAELCKRFGYFDQKQLERPAVQHLVCNFDWEKMPDLFKTKSLEKIYKRLFASEGNCQECLNNRDGFGKFFLQDCNCEDCNLSSATLSEKAERLYTSLPAFEVIDEQHAQILKEYNVCHKGISIEDLYIERQNFYNTICTKLGKNRILIGSIK